MKIAIATDHAGFELKEKIKKLLLEKKYQVKDFGSYSFHSVDYPDYIHPAASSVENKESNFGIILCGSGQGAAMTANKHQGVRAALCWNVKVSQLARRHNNANILTIPVRFVSESLAFEIINSFFSSDFEGGRHQDRINKISCI